MSILKKVKSLVSGDSAETAEKKEKKAKKVSSVIQHTDEHDHAGHDHSTPDHITPAPAPEAVEPEKKVQQVEGVQIGVGATQFTLMPMITEKGTHAAANNTYLFKAAPHASKGSIKQAIEKLYKVSVLKVRTSRYDGKVVRTGKIEGRRSNFKKVYVTVAKGQSITIHKGV